jgi:hypothetical protein
LVLDGWGRIIALELINIVHVRTGVAGDDGGLGNIFDLGPLIRHIDRLCWNKRT